MSWRRGCLFTAEVDKKSKTMLQLQTNEIHVVEEGFLDDVIKPGATVAVLVTQHSIASWGTDVSLLRTMLFDVFVHIMKISASTQFITFDAL